MFLFRLPPRPGKLRPSRAHRCKFAAFSAGQKAGWRSCDPLRFQSGPQIHHSKFKIQNYELGAQPAALFRVQIQNSKFKITHSGRSLRSTHVRIRTAGLRRREAAGCCAHSGANSEFNIQNSKSRARAAACGEAVQSGPMGRELRASAPPQAAARRPLTRSNVQQKASITATHRSLRDRFHFRDQPAAERMGLHERTFGTRACSPPPGGGCGLPTSATSSLLKNISATAGGCGLPIASQSNRKAPDRTPRPSDQRS